MTDKSQLYQKLRSIGQRVTPQKRAILDILIENPARMLSVSDICSRLPEGSGIDDATVYRNVRGFAECGLLETMIDLKGHSRYMLCDCEHHHHFICTDCGCIINFPCNNPFWRGLAQEHGFKESGHRIEVFGLCANCQKK